MSSKIVLASSSRIRSQMLTNAGIPHESIKTCIDEDAAKIKLLSNKTTHYKIAEKLAETKAEKVTMQRPQSYVIGCDQVLSFEGKLYSKPKNKLILRNQLREMSGKTHELISVAVVYKDMKLIWSHAGSVKLSMRRLSDSAIERYVETNWRKIKFCAGGYEIESKGVQLIEKIDGDFFTILGMPLLEVISFFKESGILD